MPDGSSTGAHSSHASDRDLPDRAKAGGDNTLLPKVGRRWVSPRPRDGRHPGDLGVAAASIAGVAGAPTDHAATQLGLADVTRSGRWGRWWRRSHESGGARATARSRSTDSSDRSSRTSSRRETQRSTACHAAHDSGAAYGRGDRDCTRCRCRSDATCCAYAGTRNGKWCRNWKWDRERRGSGIWTRCGARWRHRRRQLSTRQRSHDARARSRGQTDVHR